MRLAGGCGFFHEPDFAHNVCLMTLRLNPHTWNLSCCSIAKHARQLTVPCWVESCRWGLLASRV